MVIFTSESNTTLVSLDHNDSCTQEKHQQQRARAIDVYYETALYTPNNKHNGRLMLSHSVNVDESLRYYYQESCHRLFDQGTVHYDNDTQQQQQQQRILYVQQGEVAHCTASQADVVVSDRATTCHIVAVYSQSSNNNKQPLCSLLHLDGSSYRDCLSKLLQVHREWHQNRSFDMDLHIVGGFVDDHAMHTSNWLLHTLSELIVEEEDLNNTCTVRLQTACIGSLNHDDHNHGPRGRGLALNCRTGGVQLAHCSNVLGPHPVLRACRLWSSSRTLHVIHTPCSGDIVLHRFVWPTCHGIDKLLSLDNDTLLDYCSTSPEYEEDDFCDNLRAVLTFLKKHNASSVFRNKPLLRFRRSKACPNTWTLRAM